MIDRRVSGDTWVFLLRWFADYCSDGLDELNLETLVNSGVTCWAVPVQDSNLFWTFLSIDLFWLLLQGQWTNTILSLLCRNVGQHLTWCLYVCRTCLYDNMLMTRRNSPPNWSPSTSEMQSEGVFLCKQNQMTKSPNIVYFLLCGNQPVSNTHTSTHTHIC